MDQHVYMISHIVQHDDAKIGMSKRPWGPGGGVVVVAVAEVLVVVVVVAVVLVYIMAGAW